MINPAKYRSEKITEQDSWAGVGMDNNETDLKYIYIYKIYILCI